MCFVLVCDKCFVFQVPPSPWPPAHDDCHGSEAHSTRSASPPPERDFLEDAGLLMGKQRALLALHTRLAGFFPDEFHLQEKLLPYYESSADASPKPLLYLDPVLEGTWLRPPALYQDTFGHWTAAAKLPPGKKMLNPPSSELKQIARSPYFYVPDEGLRRLFEAHMRDKEYLPLGVFDTASVSVKSSPHALLDFHLRHALFERFATDAYMRILVELAQCAAGVPSRGVSVNPTEATGLIPEIAKQAALANARLGQSLTAAYVGNTVALRDHVLSSFVVPPQTCEVLRGSDFGTDGLFGPLPESFVALLATQNGQGLRCTKKTAASSFGSQHLKSSAASPSLADSLQSSGSLPSAASPSTTFPPKGRGGNYRRRSNYRSKLGRY